MKIGSKVKIKCYRSYYEVTIAMIDDKGIWGTYPGKSYNGILSGLFRWEKMVSILLLTD